MEKFIELFVRCLPILLGLLIISVLFLYREIGLFCLWGIILLIWALKNFKMVVTILLILMCIKS